MSSYANKLGSEFQKVVLNQINLEDARNLVWHLLHQRNPTAFLNGTHGVDIGDLLLYMFTGYTTKVFNNTRTSWCYC